VTAVTTERPGLRSALTSFSGSFWAANVSELFERVAYYAMTALLVVYLTEARGFSAGTAVIIGGNMSAVTFGLSPFSGILADAIGYRRSLVLAYALLATGYAGAAVAPGNVSLAVALLFVACGASLVKPVITGTVQKTGTESNRAVGFSVYYTLVNIGGFLGPNLSALVRDRFGVAAIFAVSVTSAVIALIVTLSLYREPPAAAAEGKKSIAELGRNFGAVLGNPRLVVLFLCVAGWWSMFFAFLNVLPLYLKDDVHAPSWALGMTSLDAFAVVALQVVVGLLVRKMSPVRAVVLAIVVSTAGVACMGAAPSLALAAVGVVGFSIGEMIYSAHFYQYLGTLAPPGQVGMYMGFSFVPIALGSELSGLLGATVLGRFRDLGQPQLMWLAFAAVGAVSALGVYLVSRGGAARERG
jgi:dipeptide/tripeptide permease